MVKKRDLVIAVLTAFCLISTMFLVQVARGMTLGQYDPWLDITGDGKIQIDDVAWVAKAYGTAGDPTKNVNVTNWPETYSLQTGTLNISSEGGWINPIISCGGFSRLSIGLVTKGANLGAGNNVTICVLAITWMTNYSSIAYSYDYLGTNAINMTVYDGGGASVPKSFITETKGAYGIPMFNAILGGVFPPHWWVTFEYDVYLRNE